ncbi:MAG: Rab family GTPase [Promethearchaeota archaeon]
MTNILKYKVVLIGDPAVGKTSLLYQFFKGTFKEDYTLTIGVQVLTKDITFKNATVKLTCWDIGGQHRFVQMRKNFYLGCHGALVVYDLTREDSFDNLGNWINEMNEVLGFKVPFVVIGNKSDLIQERGRQINPSKVQLFQQAYNNCFHIETSAKTGEKVKDAFKELIIGIVKSKGKNYL